MALDGITIAALVCQFKKDLTDAYVERIIQPQEEVIQINFKTASGPRRLVMSANASIPYLYETEKNMTAPLKAPSFCMLLRKYIGKGRLLSVSQPSLERIVHFTFSHLTELKDQDSVTLIAEMMGKYSNLILVNSSGMILGAVRPVSSNVSSLREVLPGRDYFLPEVLRKTDPLSAQRSEFMELIRESLSSVYRTLLESYAGISPAAAFDICHRAGIDDKMTSADMNAEERESLWAVFSKYMEIIRAGAFTPCVCYENERPKDCFAITPSSYPENAIKYYDTISTALENYYSERSAQTFIRQKSSDLRQIITTHLDRANRKYHIQTKQLKDTEKKDHYRICGEMIQCYAYLIKPGMDKLTAPSYEDGKEMSISLDPKQSAQKNAQKYFAKYAKMKRTYDALSVQIAQTTQEIAYLESALVSLAIAANDSDLDALREELGETGFAKKKRGKKKKSKRSEPMHYISSDGYDIYIGKNNIQNDELTFKLAGNKDLWFHAKQMPGSHVIVLTRGQESLPDRLYIEAAGAAAFYSRGSSSPKVDVDYVRRKEIKKPPGSKPGYVIYHTNYSITVQPDISGLTQAGR